VTTIDKDQCSLFLRNPEVPNNACHIGTRLVLAGLFCETTLAQRSEELDDHVYHEMEKSIAQQAVRLNSRLPRSQRA